MDKSQAMQGFWQGFSLPAYDEYSVPDDAVMPYITYSSTTDSLDGSLALSGSLWYRSTTWEDVTKKAEEIAEYIVNMTPIPINTGYLWIVKGTPFAQRMADPEDDMVRRIYISITAEYLTAF